MANLQSLTPNLTRLAVIIPVFHDPDTRRRERLSRQHQLAACLESLIQARRINRQAGIERWKAIELVIADDHSKVPVETLLLPPVLSEVRILRNTGTAGQAGALNFTMSQVQAQAYAFTDSDCVVALDWFNEMGAHYCKHSSHMGVTGPNWLFQEPRSAWIKMLTRQESLLMQHIFENYVDRTRSLSWRIDCRNLSLRAEFLNSYSPYREFFTAARGPSVSGQTTYEMQNFLVSHGFEIGFSKTMKTFQSPIESLWAQATTYFCRGNRGDFCNIYKKSYETLSRAFIKRYWRRHFVHPCTRGGVFWPFLALMHGAYWIGILTKRSS